MGEAAGGDQRGLTQSLLRHMQRSASVLAVAGTGMAQPVGRGRSHGAPARHAGSVELDGRRRPGCLALAGEIRSLRTLVP